MQGHIYIHGNIGSFTSEKGVETKGVELLDVISQVKSQPKATSFLAHIGSPGGLVDTGDQIYDYLQSLKVNGINVDTISDSYTDTETGELKSGVGSIATKIFLAGTNRSIIDGHEFFIHNPWTQPQAGDSVAIKAELKALEQKETELRSFYQQHTKVTDTGLKGLMDNQTGMNADQAVTLGFATKKITAQKVKAFAQLNNNKMADTKTFAQMVSDLTDSIKAILPGGIKAALPGQDPMMPGSEPGEDPNQLPDGEYPLADGRVLVITGGQIAEVKMPAAAQQPAAGAPAAPAAAVAPTVDKALLDKVAALEAKNKEMEEEQKKALQALEAFQATMVSGKSPAKAFNNNGGNGDNPNAGVKIRSIAQVQAAKREERQKTINRN